MESNHKAEGKMSYIVHIYNRDDSCIAIVNRHYETFDAADQEAQRWTSYADGYRGKALQGSIENDACHNHIRPFYAGIGGAL